MSLPSMDSQPFCIAFQVSTFNSLFPSSELIIIFWCLKILSHTEMILQMITLSNMMSNLKLPCLGYNL